MMKEKYYGIRIGNPREHKPYLMWRDDRNTPELFRTRAAAEESALKKVPNRTDCKVVCVNIHETKSAQR